MNPPPGRIRLRTELIRLIQQVQQPFKLSVLLVQQNANLALEISHDAYVLETGHVVMQGTSVELRINPELKAAYLNGN